MIETQTTERVLLAALRYLAGNDPDGAGERNGVGFNKMDSGRGHALAALGHLDPLQTVIAYRIVAKYRKQLEAGGIALPQWPPVVDVGQAAGFDYEPEPARERPWQETLDEPMDWEDVPVGKPEPSIPDMREVLGPNGSIAAHLPGYEPREPQIRMAETVAQAITAGEHAIVEAGTGTGKSLAYLIPAIYSGKKTIVSTAVKTLQDQLINKDCPFLAGVLDRPFKAVALKGRSNYLCVNAWNQEIGDQEMFGASDEYQAVKDWLQGTETGDLEELSFGLSGEFASKITCTSDACLGQQCPSFSSCFAERAKARAEAADLVVVNHTLLTLDCAIRASSDGYASVLPDRDLIVVDECFPQGTLIDTPNGERPIESVHPGDVVWAVDPQTGVRGPKRVMQAYRNPAPQRLVKVTAGGRAVVCTSSHPFYTPTGWKPAGNLLPDIDTVLLTSHSLEESSHDKNTGDLCRMRKAIHDNELETKGQFPASRNGLLLEGLQQQTQGSGHRERTEGEATTLALRTNETTQPHGQLGDTREDARRTPSHEVATSGPERQRLWSNQTAGSFGRCPGLGNRGCCSDRLSEMQPAMYPNGLQGRYCQSESQDSGRGRRIFACSSQQESTGRQEGAGLAWSRVDSIEILESAGDREPRPLCPDGLVYNLEVENFHTYVAQGFVVHNCHRLEDAATLAFQTEVSPVGVGRLLRDKQVREAAIDPDKTAKVEAASTAFFEALGRLSTQQAYTIDEPPTSLRTLAENLALQLHDLARELERKNPNRTGTASDALKKLVQRIHDYGDTFTSILFPADGEVLYVERRQGRRDTLIYLRRCPISVADDLREALFEKWPVVSTSATLAAGGSFEFFRSRCGCEGGRTLIVDSPFDYARNSVIYLPGNGVQFDPSRFYQDGSVEYYDRLAEQIEQLLLASDGRAFCLFTSNRALNEVHSRIAHRLRWLVLRQGDAPRPELLRQFKENGRAVLFATKSFWEGVDVRGEALSLVIIDKLPFGQPEDPIYKARCDEIVRRTGDRWAWFNELALPSAIIALKQGFGRLIRTRSDWGVVALLDGRITTKSYGGRVLGSLPLAARTRSLEAVRTFYETRTLSEGQARLL